MALVWDWASLERWVAVEVSPWEWASWDWWGGELAGDETGGRVWLGGGGLAEGLSCLVSVGVNGFGDAGIWVEGLGIDRMPTRIMYVYMVWCGIV